MGRSKVHPTQKKISLTISVPFYIWQMAQQNGNHTVVEAVKLGLWAKEHNVNEQTLLQLKEDHTQIIKDIYKKKDVDNELNDLMDAEKDDVS